MVFELYHCWLLKDGSMVYNWCLIIIPLMSYNYTTCYQWNSKSCLNIIPAQFVIITYGFLKFRAFPSGYHYTASYCNKTIGWPNYLATPGFLSVYSGIHGFLHYIHGLHNLQITIWALFFIVKLSNSNVYSLKLKGWVIYIFPLKGSRPFPIPSG